MEENSEYDELINEIEASRQPSPARMRHDKQDLIQWQLDPKEILEQVEHDFRGEYQDSDGKWKRKVDSKAIMNELGINSVMSILKSRISKVFNLSNFTESDVNMMALQTSMEIIEAIAENYYYWDLQFSDFDKVRNMVVHNIFATLKRGFGDGERRYLGRIEQVIHKITSSNDGGKQKGFNKLNPFN